jgi:hypothetical protein
MKEREQSERELLTAGYVEVAEPISIPRPERPMVKGTIRAWWLNAFTITSTILMWTWLTVALVAAIAFTVSATGSDSSPFQNRPTEGSAWTDSGGYHCNYYDTDSNDVCPDNPAWAGLADNPGE